MNVLISSAGRRVALLRLFREALRGLGLDGRVFAADMSAASSAYHEADRSFLVPPCNDPNFVPAVLDLCREAQVSLVVPTIDPELEIYAAQRERFLSAGVTVAVSTPAVTQIGADKAETHRWLVRAGFPTVEQATVAEVLEDPERWRFPLMVKPRRGSSSIGVGVVADREELSRATSGGEFVVQTISTGIEYTIDLLAARDGRCVCAVPRRRVETRHGESSKGMTVRLPVLEDLGIRICESLPGAYGALNVQIMLDDEGRCEVIEINPRFGGGFPLSNEAGATFPRWMIEELAGVPSTASRDWQDEVVMLRYDDAVFVPRKGAGL